MLIAEVVVNRGAAQIALMYTLIWFAKDRLTCLTAKLLQQGYDWYTGTSKTFRVS